MKKLIVLLALIVPVSSARAQGAAAGGTVDSAGLTLHYSVLGKGQPVVMLAGGPGMDADYLQPVVEMIAATGHTAILLQQRGTGASRPAEVSEKTVSAKLMLADMEALRTKLGYSKWIVMGHSFGSLMAEEYAIAHPQQVRALLLMGALPPVFSEVSHADDNVMARFTMAERAALLTMPGNAGDSMKSLRMVLAADFYDRGKGEEFAATQTAANFHTDTMGALEAGMANFDVRDGLEKLKVKTLIIQGRQDPYDLQLATETRELIKGAVIQVVEKAGHFGWLEQPEMYGSAIKDYMKEVEQQVSR